MSKNKIVFIFIVNFSRSSNDLVVENIFRIFDPYRTESIRFTDLLIAFSMSMKGSGKDIRYLCSQKNNFWLMSQVIMNAHHGSCGRRWQVV